MEVNKQTLRGSINEALKGKEFEARVKMVVEKASVQDAIRQAFSKAGLNYNTTASDVRSQRILEIQARMAHVRPYLKYSLPRHIPVPNVRPTCRPLRANA